MVKTYQQYMVIMLSKGFVVTEAEEMHRKLGSNLAYKYAQILAEK